MLDLTSPAFRQNPYPYYQQLRAMDPVLWVSGLFGSGAWVVTGHQEAAAALKDNRLGKESHKVLPDNASAGTLAGFRQKAGANMLFRDPPDHTRLRGLVNQAFTPRVVEALAPRIHEIADQLIDVFAGAGEVDLIEAFATPLPVIVIAELLGVPTEMRDQFRAWSAPLAASLDPTATPDMMQATMNAYKQLDDYFSGVIEERRKAPGQDLVSLLLTAHDQGDKLATHEMLATCRLLLAAGHETTVNLIGNGTLALLRHPEQRQLLEENPQLLAGAVEELLRYDSPVQMTARIALEEATLGGHTIKRADQLITVLGAANRDPRHFEDPDRLDLTRKNAASHLAFSQGIHYCLGAPLARLEGQIAISTLLRRLPELRLATEDLPYRGNITLRGLQQLPVAF
jgi:cytochrome P450